MSVIFTEEVDRLRIDLNTAERGQAKAEYDKKQLEKRFRVEQERAERAEKQLGEFQHDLAAYRRRLTELQADVTRLAHLENEISQARTDFKEKKAELERLEVEHERVTVDLDATRDELSERTAERDMLKAEVGPTRSLLQALKLSLEAEGRVRDELVNYGWGEV